MILRRGDSNNGVAIVQFALNNLTAMVPQLKTDGIFGVKTEERVREHQSQQRLVPDGVVGPITLDSLFDIVQMTATTKFTQIESARPVPSFQLSQSFKPQTLSFPGGSLIPPFRPPTQKLPPLPNLQSTNIAEFFRQQQAFWTWFGQPQPKPAMPQIQAVIVPIPGPFGPVFLPLAHQQIVVAGPPAKVANAKVNVEPEGGAFTISIKADVSADVAKLKFKEATYGIGLDWVVLKGRLAAFEISPAVARNNKGETAAEVEVTIKGGSGLTLKKKFGELGVVKFLPYLATAVNSELAFQASGGVKASAEINITKIGPVALKAEIGVKGGPKLTYGPVKQPDGREEHQITATPFGGTGFISFGGEF